jgi:hypothetical protein
MARWNAKPGWDQRAARGCKTDPKCLLLLFGLSFEREPDIVRIETILKCEPDAKVLSISLHPCPKENEMSVLGDLFKYYPERYEHVETNFREERGLKTLMERVHSHNLPARGYLDYAWLQTNYYKERPQGYGMNWLPMKTDGKSSWTIGKIKMLMEVQYIFACRPVYPPLTTCSSPPRHTFPYPTPPPPFHHHHYLFFSHQY